MSKIITVAVLGSTGFVGLELIKILLRHPKVKINFLGCENFPNSNINQFDSKMNTDDLPLLDLNSKFNPKNSDLVFLSLPHGISHNFVKLYYDKIRIIDLSADFRLDKSNIYETNYNLEHSCPNLLDKFIYGLPELNKEFIKKSKNIAVPGCYPTSVLLPLVPLFKDRLLSPKDIIIDSKSGYSGAGKKFDIKNIKNSDNLNFYNYNTNEHRHICEIQQELNKFSEEHINFSFNPHILPIFRGMMSSIYCNLNNNIKIRDIDETLKNFSKELNFVHFIRDDKKTDFFSIQNTNNCLIKLYKHENNKKVIIVSLIDNLLKGAAGQAIQCFNLIYNFEEELSLT